MVSEMNIVGSINRKDIIGDVPVDAQYAGLSPKGFIQKFYKFKEVRFNDGTTNNTFNYLSERNIWVPSSYNNTEIHKLKIVRFLKIDD